MELVEMSIKGKGKGDEFWQGLGGGGFLNTRYGFLSSL